MMNTFDARIGTRDERKEGWTWAETNGPFRRSRSKLGIGSVDGDQIVDLEAGLNFSTTLQPFPTLDPHHSDGIGSSALPQSNCDPQREIRSIISPASPNRTRSAPLKYQEDGLNTNRIDGENDPFFRHLEAGKVSARGAINTSGCMSYTTCNTSSTLPSDSIQRALYECSRGTYPDVWYKFKRFETLSLLNLYHYQHDLIQLEKKIMGRSKAGITGAMEPDDRQLLRKLLKEYQEAIQLFKEISRTKRPDMPLREKTASTLDKVLHEDHYSRAPDALAMLDLTPQSLGMEPDSIRVLLHKTFYESRNRSRSMRTNTYEGSVDLQQAVFDKPAPQPENSYENRTPGAVEPKELFPGRPYAIKISSTVDRIARVLTAFLAGLFLLVPMVALSYIKSKKYCLIATCLCVVVFAVVLAFASKASNQELITATATYAAVLVVFVGQTSLPS